MKIARKQRTQKRLSLAEICNTPLLMRAEAVRQVMAMGEKELVEVFFDVPHDGQGTRISQVVEGVGIIQIHGAICQRGGMLSYLFGDCPVDFIKHDLDLLLAEESVKSIILDIDSPGGMTAGVQELANRIFAARDQKKIVAIANPMAASAGYWIGCAASKFYLCADTAIAGSIGTIFVHTDESKASESLGLKMTEIVSAKYKNAMSPNKPLSEEGQQEIYRLVSEIHQTFVSAVAKFRGISMDQANTMADGRVHLGQSAVKLGFADGIMTLEELVNQIGADMNGKDKQGTGAVAPAPSNTNAAITAEVIQRDHPAVYKAIFDKGKQDGLCAGAQKERARIKAIEGMTPAGMEAEAAKAKFDGVTKPEQFAMNIAKHFTKNAAPNTTPKNAIDKMKGEQKIVPFAGTTPGQEVDAKKIMAAAAQRRKEKNNGK